MVVPCLHKKKGRSAYQHDVGNFGGRSLANMLNGAAVGGMGITSSSMSVRQLTLSFIASTYTARATSSGGRPSVYAPGTVCSNALVASVATKCRGHRQFALTPEDAAASVAMLIPYLLTVNAGCWRIHSVLHMRNGGDIVTMLPLDVRNGASASCIATRVVLVLTDHRWSIFSGDATGDVHMDEALFTSTSMPPRWKIAVLIASRVSSPDRWSTGKAVAEAPRSSHRSATPKRLPCERDDASRDLPRSAMWQPGCSLANCLATAAPMPRDAPVMSTLMQTRESLVPGTKLMEACLEEVAMMARHGRRHLPRRAMINAIVADCLMTDEVNMNLDAAVQRRCDAVRVLTSSVGTFIPVVDSRMCVRTADVHVQDRDGARHLLKVSRLDEGNM